MATASAREFQPIPVIRDDVDTSAQLIALLDATLDHHRALVALAAAVPGARRYSASLLSIDPTEDNERVLRLWASAHNFSLRDETFQYDPSPDRPHGYAIRAIRVYADAQFGAELVHMSFGAVAKPAPVAVTASAIREALRAPHWTDENTLTDEERAERERMEAGHA